MQDNVIISWSRDLIIGYQITIHRQKSRAADDHPLPGNMLHEIYLKAHSCQN